MLAVNEKTNSAAVLSQLDNYDEKMSLLIIHDSRETLLNLCETFGEEYKVDIAFETEQAMFKIKTKQYDLVLVFANGKTGDPVELSRFMARQLSSDVVPLIVSSDYESEKEETLLLSIGILDYIDMWASPEILYCRVRNHMSLLRKNKTLTVLSSTDPLTGLLDKRLFNTRLKTEWQQAQRSETPLSVLLIDIDDFKLFNDNFGHLKGDECLKRVANVLQKTASRESDYAFRFGGEEFVILLPHTDSDGARKIAASVLESVRQLDIQQAEAAVHERISVSIGCASCKPSYEQIEFKNTEVLLDVADKLMYEAKNTGKNKLVFSEI